MPPDAQLESDDNVQQYRARSFEFPRKAEYRWSFFHERLLPFPLATKSAYHSDRLPQRLGQHYSQQEPTIRCHQNDLTTIRSTQPRHELLVSDHADPLLRRFPPFPASIETVLSHFSAISPSNPNG